MGSINKEKLDIFIIALQESFISFTPYIIVASITILLPQIIYFLSLDKIININYFIDISKIINRFIPLVACISIAYHFAIRYNTNQMIVILLSLISLISVEYITTKHLDNIPISHNINFTVLTIPIISTLFINKLSKYFNINFSDFNAYIYIYRIFKYIYTFIISYILITILYLTIHWLFAHTETYITQFAYHISDHIMLYIRTIIIQTFWFIGVHGPHMASSILDTSFLSHDIFIGLSYQKFYQLFALSGGSGVGLAIIFALLLNKQNKQSIKIAKIALPFSIFNINGILIYGLPIVFNRYLFLPFLLIPILDITLAYWFLQWHHIIFMPIKFAWTTPIFINGWILSNGDIFVIILQFILLVLNTIIYLPFIKKYTQTTNKSYYINELEKKLNITTSIQVREGLPILKVQKDILNSSHKIEDIIKLINKNTLLMHYQPKVNIQNYNCTQYEALLRVKKSDGSLSGPYFISDLENAGLAPVIDIWVAKEVKKDLLKWKRQGYYPSISINLHPDTLADSKAIEQIIKELEGENIEFEILERSLLENQVNNIIEKLKQHGFAIAIDDFGVGYSSFDLITNFNIDTIKMDKSIIDLMNNPKGYAVCKHIISLCKEINCKCIAEGVETKEQLEKLSTIGAKYIQGYYFSKALPPEKLLEYTISFKSQYT